MEKMKLIWDIPLRLFHWAFALTFILAWITAKAGSDYMQYHIINGYVMASLLTFRVMWGFWGTRYAKFKQFFPSYKKLKRHVSQLQQKEIDKTPGHNPVGSLMVFCLLALVLIQIVSGLFISDDVYSSGPYYNTLNDDIQGMLNSLHHFTFDLLLWAIFCHVLAIGYYWRVKKINLVLPMITGRKPKDLVADAEEIKGSRLRLAVVIAFISASFIYWLVVVNAPESIAEFYL